MVKVFIVFERQCVGFILVLRIVVLESVNLLGLLRKRGEEDFGKDRKKKGIVEIIYKFDDVLKFFEK